MHSSSRNRHPHLKAKNKPDTVNNIVKVKVGPLTRYRCVVCGNELSRRFNADRHYRRFHKMIQTRECCEKTFYTKSDYYDHKKIVHNEYKRYGRAWEHETQPSSNFSTSKTSISAKTKEKKPEKSTNTKCAHHMKDNAVDSKSSNKEESKTNVCHRRNPPIQQSAKSPMKIFIFRMQIGTDQNRVPLRSIENCKRIVKVSSSTKRNVIDYTATSVSDLMQLMSDTICKAF